MGEVDKLRGRDGDVSKYKGGEGGIECYVVDFQRPKELMWNAFT